ncbi:DUF4249 domain-containing protein [Carboxylicivirga caseinilyticus]|uniref:DUF4249 domain-containing protein n=1 Tax=Carboxylicivirga caseinilyticus TaxID=3417572 RepID=UPI003D344C8B|nr:DUF4249 domain-containing protein [Marinilabiliaceae bacterium A049]
MRWSIIKYSLIVSFLLLMLSCEKDILIELNDQPDKLVMYSFIYPDSALSLHFSKSQSILSVPSYKQVENARFRISINGVNQGTYILPSDTVWSNWKEFTFSKGDDIVIEAFEREGDTILVESYLPGEIPIEKMDTSTINYSYTDGIQMSYLKTKVSFSDPLAEEDYYQLYIIREGYGMINNEPYYTRDVVDYDKDDPIFLQKDQSGSLLQGLNFQGLFTDELVNGITYTINVNIPKDYLFFDYYEDKIKISLYLYHHTYDYYSYFRSKVISAGYDGFYEGLPIFDPNQIHNNIDGGLGLVSGMSFDVDSIVLYQ